jgi:hypothetical protein
MRNTVGHETGYFIFDRSSVLDKWTDRQVTRSIRYKGQIDLSVGRLVIMQADTLHVTYLHTTVTILCDIKHSVVLSLLICEGVTRHFSRDLLPGMCLHSSWPCSKFRNIGTLVHNHCYHCPTLCFTNQGPA